MAEIQTIPSTDGNQPLYLQVHQRLLGEIASAGLRPGDRLPAERALCEKFGISRVTLRRALEVLADEGIIESSTGRGWFLSEGPLSPASFVSFSSMGETRGLQATARVLRQRVRAATLDEAEALGIAPGNEIFELERVRMLDEMLIAIDHSRVPLQHCPSLPTVDFAVASLYAVLEERSGIIPSRCAYVVEAAPATESEAELLDLAPGEPLLVNQQVVYDQNGRVIELGRIAYRYDRFRFRAELRNPLAPTPARVL